MSDQWWSSGFEEYDSDKATRPQILMLQSRIHLVEKLCTQDEVVALRLGGPGIFLKGMSKRRASELISLIKTLAAGVRGSLVKKLSEKVEESKPMFDNICTECGGEVSIVGSLHTCSKCGAAFLKLDFAREANTIDDQTKVNWKDLQNAVP